MKIATLNIDWSRKNKTQKIEDFLQQQDFDFLILTEAVYLNLPNYKYTYTTEQIPSNQIYEGLNYTEYLKGKESFRVIVYSKIPIINKFEISDNKTSLALEFETDFGKIIIYSTIIGTWFKKQPYAKIELENCIKDCEEIYSINQNLFIVGDLNTSFQDDERVFTINTETTESLKSLFEKLNLTNATQQIKRNIDHIVMPMSFENKLIKSDSFIGKNVLSDHQGVFIHISHSCFHKRYHPQHK